jgi:tRNA-uridine 2-sulfurtransferase
MNVKKKVLVALSGGVDSSVSAALLLEQGYDVEGAFITTWTVPWLPCTWREERRDAMRVAATLHIPFQTINLSQEYEKNVVEYLIDEYRHGRTPNPDVMCNKHIKFGGFFDWAMERGFDYVATGHYARVQEIENEKTPRFQMLTGVDTNKDQTYFLWTLTQKHLAHTLFPVGQFEKPYVRELASKYNLPTATKKDSQGICFLGKVDMKEFLSHYITPIQGDVLNTQGEVIGSHDGAVFLTLGQRHGFTAFQSSPESVPLYVIAKDIEKNTITVAPEFTLEQALKHDGGVAPIHLTDVNWISKTTIAECEARLRYRQNLFPITLTDMQGSTCTVTPHTPQPYVQKGQSVVFYKNDTCLGGGIIA